MNLQKNTKREHGKVRGARIDKTVALLVLFCLCIGGISMVSAKYMKQNETKNNAATASEFYFESDLLDGKVHEIVPTDNNGTTASVTVRLKNYADELRYSEVAIEYTVTVTEQDDTSVSGVQIKYPNSDDNTTAQHIIAAEEKNHADVTLSGLQAGHNYIVTATTNNLYQKTLTGTIKVAQPDTSVYASISDKTQYIEVTIWTTDYAGAVKLNYGNIGLIPDNTDTKMVDAKSTGGTIAEGNWGANTSHVFRFFKTDVNKQYQVTVNNENNESKEVTVSEKQQ